jgi:hypothetical protein
LIDILTLRVTLWKIALSIVLGAVFVCAAAQPVSSQWRVNPEVRVTGGDESDLVIDPGVTRTIVPGGAFIELTPAIAGRTFVGDGGLLDIGAFASFQRFFNSESRLLYGQSVWGNLLQNFGKGFRTRLSASFNYFDDSERREVRRLGLGGELGVGLVRRKWNTELWGGVRGRHYPNLAIIDTRNRLSAYQEVGWSGGVVIRTAPNERLGIRADGILQGTEANDPYSNSNSWTLAGSVDARLVSTLFLTVSGTYQERKFVNRLPGEDRDDYWQAGVGLRYAVISGWTALVRYGFSNYTWTDGSDEDTHRLAIGFQYAWGRTKTAPLPRVDFAMLTRESEGTIQQPEPDGRVVFRIRAPEAKSVSVAGSFNEWDSKGTALSSVGDGWWEARLVIGPGTYEYIYRVDGKWTTPPEAKVTVDDGFGGRNGILEVLPPDL